MRTRTRVAAALVTAMLTAVAATVATAGGGLRAELDGKPISLNEAASLSCHDFLYPTLTCFRTIAEFEAALVEHNAADASLQVAATGYVVVFRDATYAGQAATLSSDYAWLSDIGWNDRISAFKSYGATGRFYEHSPSGGLVYYFGGSTWVPYVGDAYNDKFSSFYID